MLTKIKSPEDIVPHLGFGHERLDEIIPDAAKHTAEIIFTADECVQIAEAYALSVELAYTYQGLAEREKGRGLKQAWDKMFSQWRKPI